MWYSTSLAFNLQYLFFHVSEYYCCVQLLTVCDTWFTYLRFFTSTLFISACARDTLFIVFFCKNVSWCIHSMTRYVWRYSKKSILIYQIYLFADSNTLFVWNLLLPRFWYIHVAISYLRFRRYSTIMWFKNTDVENVTAHKKQFKGNITNTILWDSLNNTQYSLNSAAFKYHTLFSYRFTLIFANFQIQNKLNHVLFPN